MISDKPDDKDAGGMGWRNENLEYLFHNKKKSFRESRLLSGVIAKLKILTFLFGVQLFFSFSICIEFASTTYISESW